MRAHMGVVRSREIGVQVSHVSNLLSSKSDKWIVQIYVDRSPWKALEYESPITVVEALSLAAVEWKLSGTEE